MKERPILFSGPMVRALIDGRKTQTRRVVNFPKWADAAGGVEFSGLNDGPAALCSATGCFADLTCRYGAAGDRLWVRETWRKKPYTRDRHQPHPDVMYRADIRHEGNLNQKHLARALDEAGQWTPAIHMFRWASRINLEVTGLRVERLKSIAREDAIAEGATERPLPRGELLANTGWSCDWSRVGQSSKFAHNGKTLAERDIAMGTPYGAYANLWSEINGADSWAANPWVWVIEFKQVKP